MDKEVKQSVFFSFLRTIFNDKSHTGIDNKNCDGFYFYIVDFLEKDCEIYLNLENDEKYFFFQTVLSLIEDFDKMPYGKLKEVIQTRRHFSQYLVRETPSSIDKKGLINILKSLEYKYFLAKEDFLKG